MPWKHWSNERLGLALAVLAALGFSFKAIFVKLAYAVPQAQPVDSVTLLALRMAFSLPFFAWVGWSASRKLAPLQARDWLTVLALGLLGYYGASILDFMGLQYISASLERLILFVYPTLTLLLGVLFLGKKASGRELGALLLSYLGIGLAFAHDLHIAGDTRQVLIGAALVLGSALSYAFYQAGSEPAIRRMGTARFTALALLVSTLARCCILLPRSRCRRWCSPRRCTCTPWAWRCFLRCCRCSWPRRPFGAWAPLKPRW